MGHVPKPNLLHPDLELTYEKCRELRFDPEASLLLALEAVDASENAKAPTTR